MIFKINNVLSRVVFNSKGNPAIEVEIFLKDDICGRFISPSGTSIGKLESSSLIDSDNFGMNSIKSNLDNIIFPTILGKKFSDIQEFDQFLCDLDGTKNKSRLGSNAIIACSVAFVCAMARQLNIPLYKLLNQIIYGFEFYQHCELYPFINVINGGYHADNDLAIQEFLIIPQIEGSFSEKMMLASKINYNLKSIIKKNGLSVNVGDEGGLAPNLGNTYKALDILSNLIDKLNYPIKLGLDVAANTFYSDADNCYHVDNQKLNTNEMIKFYQKLVHDYPIISIEDPLSEDYPEEWGNLKIALKEDILIVSDDLTVTNSSKIIKYYNNFSAVIIKLNQIGTVTETIQAIKTAHNLGLKVIISHRSADTEDVVIAHLALACNAYGIKAGGMSRSERLAKYNEIIRILD